MDIIFITNLLILLVTAGLGKILSRKIAQPVILGQLLLGMLLGNIVLVSLGYLGPVTLSKAMYDLADIGILFLLFSAGFAINFEEFKRLAKSSGIATLTDVTTCFILGYLVARAFQFDYLTALFIGGTLTATSVGIQTAVLRDLRMLGGRVGILITGIAIDDDVVGILILAVLGGIVTMSGILWDKIVLLFIASAIFFALSLTLGVYLIQKLSRRFMMRKESLLLMALIIIFFFSIAAKGVGLEAIIGSFIAGLILGQSYFAREIIEQISIFGDAFFVPIFFVIMGMGFNLGAITSLGLFAVTLILAAILGKVIGCGSGAKIAGFSWRESLAIGTAMIPRAEVCLIISSVGIKYGILSQDVASVILLLVLVTSLITPPILKKSLRLIQ